MIVPFDRFLPVKGDGEVIVLKIDSQAVPLIRRHLRTRPLLFSPATLDRVVNRDVVFQRVRPSDVVIVGILGSPDESSSLIFLAGCHLSDILDRSLGQIALERSVYLEQYHLYRRSTSPAHYLSWWQSSRVADHQF